MNDCEGKNSGLVLKLDFRKRRRVIYLSLKYDINVKNRIYW